MIKKVSVYSRQKILKMLWEDENSIQKDKNWALISIYSYKSSSIFSYFKAITRAKEIGCLDLLEERFSDVTQEDYNRGAKFIDPVYLFDKNMAKNIINFLKKINNSEEITELLVNCAAGISRSGAVGLFANRFFQLDEYTFFERNKQIKPNPWVYDLLYKVSGLRDTYEKWWNSMNGI